MLLLLAPESILLDSEMGLGDSGVCGGDDIAVVLESTALVVFVMAIDESRSYFPYVWGVCLCMPMSMFIMTMALMALMGLLGAMAVAIIVVLIARGVTGLRLSSAPKPVPQNGRE